VGLDGGLGERVGAARNVCVQTDVRVVRVGGPDGGLA